MDVAYDHIQEEALSPEEQEAADARASKGLNSEFQEAFKAVSASPWGAKLGGFFGQVKKQSESLYTDAQREYSNASTQASRGLTDLRSSLLEGAQRISIPSPPAGAGATTSFSDPTFALPDPPSQPHTEAGSQPHTSTAEVSQSKDKETEVQRPDSLPADIVKEATSLLSTFKISAAQRLQAVQKAEDAADEALLRFGGNVRDFLRNAVSVTAPDAARAAGLTVPDAQADNEVLFETNDAEGRRVFHGSRFDAQLHVIHTTAGSFVRDPESSAEWEEWNKGFEIEKETERIAKDLEQYEELRRAMGRLVPEKVDYASFWRRYYFLRKAVEEEERRRREVLKGAAAEAPDDDLSWGSEDEDDETKTSAAKQESQSTTPVNGRNKTAQSSSSTLTQKTVPTPATAEAADDAKLKPSAAAASPATAASGEDADEGKSTADSDASYDIVSGATSRGASSPSRETSGAAPSLPPVAAAPSASAASTRPAASGVAAGKEKERAEESEEEDWE